MKRILLIISILAFSFSLFAQNDAPNITDAKGRKQGFWKKYENKTLLYEGNFVNGVPTGKFTYYHKNGKIKSISDFLRGTSKVRTTMFHENGQKSAEGIFVDQIKDSTWQYFSEKGTLIKQETYKMGKKEGVWKTFSAETGNLLEEMTYSNDQLNGKYVINFADGKPQVVFHYINGKRNGETESFYSDNTLYSKGLYHEDFKIGTWNFYDIDQKIRKTITYKRSNPESIVLYFYNGSSAQKVNQNIIAYCQKMGNSCKIVMKNGKTFTTTDSFETLQTMLDFAEFSPVTPRIIAANEAIKGFQLLDNERVKVLLEPAPETDIIAEGNEAKIVKSLFDRSVIKEEE